MLLRHQRWFETRGARVGTVGIALALGLSGCKIAEAKIYNLEELHDPESHHRYNAALESDFEFLVRHQLFGLFKNLGTNMARKENSKVDAPADECLDYLIALEQIETANPVVAGQQVEWFSRLAVEDPWHLSRERAVLALSSAAVRLKAGLPSALGSDQKPAEPEQVANALTPLVKALRQVLEGGSDSKNARAELEQACAGVRALDYDMSGARRALAFVVKLQATAGTRNPNVAPLAELSLELQRVCVRRALARAIDDPDPLVRAAALVSAARAGGRVAIDTVLFDRLRKQSERRDADPEVLIAIVDTVGAAAPLPTTAGPGGHTRDDWLAAIYALLIRRPEEDVRVHAMMALSRLADAGFASLHEEDWQEWWSARSTAAGSSSAGASR